MRRLSGRATRRIFDEYEVIRVGNMLDCDVVREALVLSHLLDDGKHESKEHSYIFPYDSYCGEKAACYISGTPHRFKPITFPEFLRRILCNKQ